MPKHHRASRSAQKKQMRLRRSSSVDARPSATDVNTPITTAGQPDKSKIIQFPQTAQNLPVYGPMPWPWSIYGPHSPRLLTNFPHNASATPSSSSSSSSSSSVVDKVDKTKINDKKSAITVAQNENEDVDLLAVHGPKTLMETLLPFYKADLHKRLLTYPVMKYIDYPMPVYGPEPRPTEPRPTNWKLTSSKAFGPLTLTDLSVYGPEPCPANWKLTSSTTLTLTDSPVYGRQPCPTNLKKSPKVFGPSTLTTSPVYGPQPCPANWKSTSLAALTLTPLPFYGPQPCPANWKSKTKVLKYGPQPCPANWKPNKKFNKSTNTMNAMSARPAPKKFVSKSKLGSIIPPSTPMPPNPFTTYACPSVPTNVRLDSPWTSNTNTSNSSPNIINSSTFNPFSSSNHANGCSTSYNSSPFVFNSSCAVAAHMEAMEKMYFSACASLGAFRLSASAYLRENKRNPQLAHKIRRSASSQSAACIYWINAMNSSLSHAPSNCRLFNHGLFNTNPSQAFPQQPYNYHFNRNISYPTPCSFLKPSNNPFCLNPNPFSFNSNPGPFNFNLNPSPFSYNTYSNPNPFSFNSNPSPNPFGFNSNLNTNSFSFNSNLNPNPFSLFNHQQGFLQPNNVAPPTLFPHFIPNTSIYHQHPQVFHHGYSGNTSQLQSLIHDILRMNPKATSASMMSSIGHHHGHHHKSDSSLYHLHHDHDHSTNSRVISRPDTTTSTKTNTNINLKLNLDLLAKPEFECNHLDLLLPLNSDNDGDISSSLGSSRRASIGSNSTTSLQEYTTQSSTHEVPKFELKFVDPSKGKQLVNLVIKPDVVEDDQFNKLEDLEKQLLSLVDDDDCNGDKVIHGSTSNKANKASSSTNSSSANTLIGAKRKRGGRRRNRGLQGHGHPQKDQQVQGHEQHYGSLHHKDQVVPSQCEKVFDELVSLSSFLAGPKLSLRESVLKPNSQRHGYGKGKLDLVDTDVFILGADFES